MFCSSVFGNLSLQTKAKRDKMIIELETPDYLPTEEIFRLL